MDKRVADRRANFKKNFEDPRRKREDLQVQIRKTHREQNLAKKRAEALDVQDDGSLGTSGVEDISQNVPLPGGVNRPEFRPEDLPQMMLALASGDHEREFQATQSFRRALSIENNPPIQEVIDAGAVPFFVKFLKMNGRENLQFEAAWALTNIASGSQEQTRTVIQGGAVQEFVALLRSPKEEVREQAVWALGNIAGDSPGCRDLVLNSYALRPLLAQLNNSDAKISMQRNATWTLSNLCRGKPQPDFAVVSTSLDTLSKLVFSEDIEVLTDACWALSYLSDGPNDHIDRVLQSGVTHRLVDLLLHKSTLVQTPALRSVGNIVTGDDQQTQVVISCGAIPNLLLLLSSSRKTVQKEACWTVSNITAGNRDQIQAVINAGLIPPLIDLLANADFDVKKEAAWAISNAVSGGSDAQVETLVENKCIHPLCDLLDVKDSKIVSVALEAIENILRVGKVRQQEQGLAVNPFCELIEHADGVSSLERLQETENEEIYQKVLKIISLYFPFEESDPVEMDAPTNEQSIGDGSGFGVQAPQGGFKFG